MLICLAAASALAAVATADIPALAQGVQAQAEALTVSLSAPDARFHEALDRFAADSMRLSQALREIEAPADLPCIFKGISEDAQAKADALEAAPAGEEAALIASELRALFDDAAYLAPQAAALRPAPGL